MRYYQISRFDESEIRRLCGNSMAVIVNNDKALSFVLVCENSNTLDNEQVIDDRLMRIEGNGTITIYKSDRFYPTYVKFDIGHRRLGYSFDKMIYTVLAFGICKILEYYKNRNIDFDCIYVFPTTDDSFIVAIGKANSKPAVYEISLDRQIIKLKSDPKQTRILYRGYKIDKLNVKGMISESECILGFDTYTLIGIVQNESLSVSKNVLIGAQDWPDEEDET